MLTNYQYSRFKGSLITPDENKNSGLFNVVVKIYGDDYLLYESKPFGEGVLPIDFDVDISGVQVVKIEILSAGTVRAIADGGFYK